MRTQETIIKQFLESAPPDATKEEIALRRQVADIAQDRSVRPDMVFALVTDSEYKSLTDAAIAATRSMNQEAPALEFLSAANRYLKLADQAHSLPVVCESGACEGEEFAAYLLFRDYSSQHAGSSASA